jgi:hypothetical protein
MGAQKTVIANDWRAQLELINADGSPGESKFSWMSLELPISASEESGKEILSLQIDGAYAQKIQKIIFVSPQKGNELIELQDGKFSVPVVLSGESTSVEFLAVGPTGVVEKQPIKINFVNWQEYIEERTPPPNLQLPFQVLLGSTSIRLQESSVADYSALLPTVKAAYHHSIFSPEWNLEADLYTSVASLASNTSGVSARIYGTHLHVGYVLPFFKSPWLVSVFWGMQYAKMSVSNNQFGIEDLITPQFFSRINRELNSKNSLSGYIKYMPLASRLSLSLNEHEIGFGITWERLLKNGHTLSTAFDLSDLKLSAPDRSILVRTIGLSVGYGF